MKQSRLRSWLIFLVVAAIALVLLFPLYWMFVSSILPSSLVLSRTPPLIPPLDSISFEPYRQVLTRKPILTWFFNSILVTIGSAVLSMAVSTFAGYSLSRFRTRAQSFMGFFLLLNRMLPGTLLVIPFYVMFSRVHLINSPVALILANTAAIVPFATWMMKGFFDAIPVQLEEAAMVDGCTPLEAMARIILPLTAPGLAAMGMYSALLSWSDFLFARTLVSDPNHWTMTVGTASFIGEHMVEWNALMAAGIISVAPVILLFLFLERFLVSGMTSGSVKG